MANKACRQFDLIVFDWDGTLLDSTGQIVSSMQAACDDFGLPALNDKAACHTIGLDWHKALQLAVPTLDEKDYPAFFARCHRHYLSSESQIRLFEGVPEMLRELREADYLLAVATGASRLDLNRALDLVGLAHAFDATRCADETFAKPHPAMLQELSEELYQKISRTLMVGDTVHDLQMAANADAASVAIAHAGRAVPSFDVVVPKFCAFSVAELMGWLRENG